MWCKQHPTRAFLQYMRHITTEYPSSHAPPDGLYSTSHPTILSLPVSRKLLGGRANKQDKQHSHRATPTRHRRPDRLDSLRRVHRRDSRFIGGILVYIGREPFGADHVRNTTLALIFFVVGIAGTIFGFFYALTYGISSGLGASV